MNDTTNTAPKGKLYFITLGPHPDQAKIDAEIDAAANAVLWPKSSEEK
jgi:hypothetical protein